MMMNQYEYQAHGRSGQQSNAMGIAGFVCSLVGLVSVGSLSPVGLILSLIGLGREPRGLAIAGVILGVLGTCGWGIFWLIWILLIAAGVGIALGAAAFFALSEPVRGELTVDMGVIAAAIENYREREGYLPANLTLLGLDEQALTDPWGNQYHYVFLEESPGYDLISYGKDGQFGTDDDILLSKLPEYWASAPFLSVEAADQNGRVTVNLSGRKVDVVGDEKQGAVRIDLGDRVIEIIGDDNGGRVVTRAKTGQPAAAATADTQAAPQDESDALDSPADEGSSVETADESPAGL